jgi:hypothetical protein
MLAKGRKIYIMIKAYNVWFFSNHTDWEDSVIKHFQKKNIWNQVIWTSKYNQDKSFTDLSHFADVNFPEQKIIPDPIYDAIYKHLYWFVDMYSRNSPIGQNVYDSKNIHDYLNLFNLILNYYYRGFTENNIKLVIFNRAPHVGYDLLCYLLAKELNITTLILEQSIFPNRFYYYWDHFDYGNFSTSKKLFTHEWVHLEKKSEKDLFYMKRPAKNLKEKLRQIYWAPEFSLLRESINRKTVNQALYRYSLKKKFTKLMTGSIDNVDIDKINYKFVYFALHLQPEKTTSSWGGLYNDQLLAIERIVKLIPEDWKVLVKENPKQSFFMRGRWWYERLKKIPKVVLVPNETDTYLLLKKSEFASTITGTLGWEAITGEKKVLVFGWGVWYKTLPGVLQYNEQLTLQDILDYSFSIKDVEKKLNEIIGLTAEGVIYNKGKISYSNMVANYSKEDNIQKIINSLELILESSCH